MSRNAAKHGFHPRRMRSRGYATFIADLEALAARDAYFYSITMYCYVGRKRG